MKIATFNIWNSDRGMPQRKPLILAEIQEVQADVLCLQEVKKDMYGYLKESLSEYPYSYYLYNDELDGIATFSRFPLAIEHEFEHAYITTCHDGQRTIAVANCHLPWDRLIKKEKGTVEVIEAMKEVEAEYAFFVGDFNCTSASDVHRFLTGSARLQGHEPDPMWEDLGEIHAAITGQPPTDTLNIRTNPRWRGRHVAYTGSRCDKIYLRDAFPNAQPTFVSYNLFGTSVDQASGYCASDHYGVVAEIAFD